MPIIVFNGKSYNSPNEMPVNERKAYEQMMGMFVDKDGNGIPDLLEGDLVQNVLSAHSTKVNLSSMTVHSLDDLSPEMRQKVDGAFQMLSNMGILTDQSQAPQISREPQSASKPFAAQTSNVMEEEHGMSVFSIIVIGILLCLGLAAATIAVWVFMNR
jgi:hypothetical protein